MIGMLQILTYMFAFYLIVKGIEVLQVGLASSRGSRVGPILVGVATLVACIAAAMAFVWMQDKQASVLNMPTSGGASLDVSPSFGSLPDPETQAEWARGRDARNKGWKWAEEKQLSDDAPCAQLGNTDELTGCKAYVNTFGDRNR